MSKYKEYIKQTLKQFKIAYNNGNYINAIHYLELVIEDLKKINKKK